MLACVVIYRRHLREPAPLPSSLRTAPAPIEDPHPVGTGSGCLALSSSTLSFQHPLVSHLPYLLPSSVSRNSFVCHSYENCRGVYQQFPFWNSPITSSVVVGLSLPLSAIPYTLSPFFSHSCALFCTSLQFFALPKSSTHFFSCDSALFAA